MNIKKMIIVAITALLLLSTAAIASTESPFEDVGHDDWFHSFVIKGCNYGLFKGKNEKEFAPTDAMTRAEFVTVIGRMHEQYSGTPIAGTTDRYTDVDSAAYYAPYIAWATDANIIKGYGDGLFGPNDPLDREQMALIVYDYLEAFEIELTYERDVALGYFDLTDFKYQESYNIVNRLSEIGIIEGYPDNEYRPNQLVTRAEAAKVITKVVDGFPQFDN